MRIFVTGASGLVGSRLCEALDTAGHEPVGLSRSARESAPGSRLRWMQGDPKQEGAWLEEAVRADAVYHLAGESVAAARWTSARKRELAESRTCSTRLLVDAFARAPERPRVFVCASASGYYGPRGDEELREDARPGSDFLAQVCVDWEAEAERAVGLGVRVVSMRFGVVLSARGGALANMLPVFRLGLGGPLGPSDRWFPWVSLDDAVGLLLFALDHEIGGPVNAVAPEPVRMGTFARTLGRVLHRPALLPVPLLALSLLLGEMGASLVPGQKVVPGVATAAGYAFRQPTLEGALRSCLS